MTRISAATIILSLKRTAGRLARSILRFNCIHNDANETAALEYEIRILGSVLHQLHRLLSKTPPTLETGVYPLIMNIVNHCADLLDEVDTYQRCLHSRLGKVEPKYRTHGCGVIGPSETPYIRTRVNSMRNNIVFFLMLQSCYTLDKSANDSISDEQARQIQLLFRTSDSYVKQLVDFQNIAGPPADSQIKTPFYRFSLRFNDRVGSTRLIQESIMELWGQDPSSKKLFSSFDQNDQSFKVELKDQIDYVFVWGQIEKHLCSVSSVGRSVCRGTSLSLVTQDKARPEHKPTPMNQGSVTEHSNICKTHKLIISIFPSPINENNNCTKPNVIRTSPLAHSVENSRNPALEADYKNAEYKNAEHKNAEYKNAEFKNAEHKNAEYKSATAFAKLPNNRGNHRWRRRVPESPPAQLSSQEIYW